MLAEVGPSAQPPSRPTAPAVHCLLTDVPTLAANPPVDWWREGVRGSVGSVSVLALVLTLGLLAMAPLGAAGVPTGLRAGLTAAVLGGLVYALLGRAALPAASPSSATALLVAALVVRLRADPDLAGDAGVFAIVALCGVAVCAAGLLQVLAGLAGLARLALYVPRPVASGFMNGVAVQVALAQWPLLVGRPLGDQASAAAQPLALGIGLAVAVAVVFLGRRCPRWPAALLVLLAGALLHGLLLSAWPALPLGALPPLDTTLPGAMGLLAPGVWPLLLRHATPLAVTALLIAGVGLLESAMNGIALDRQRGTRHDPKRELLAIGVTNVLLGLTGGLPVVQNRSRAMSAALAGATHRFALVAGSLVLGALALAARPLLAWLPLPVLAGILLAVAWALLDRWTLQLLRQWVAGQAHASQRVSLTLVAAVMLTTLLAGLSAGVALGAVLSLLVFVVRMNRSLVRARYAASARPSRRIRMPAVEARLQGLRERVRVLEIEGALFFGSSERLLAEADQLPMGTVALVLDATRVSTVDETGVQLLQDLDARLRMHGVVLYIAGLRAAMAPQLRELDLDVSPDLDRAVEAAEDQLLAPLKLVPTEVALTDTPLLQGLGADDQAAVQRHLQRHQLTAGEHLFNEGDPGDRLYLLLAGSVSVLSQPDTEGRSQRYLSISPGMLLGETALLDGGGRTAGAVADTEATLMWLDEAALERLQREHPALAATLYRRIAVHLSQRLRGAAAAWRAGAA
jgi:sulfate permease, SulP family